MGTGLSRRTTDQWLKGEAFPEAKQRRKRKSRFDPYAAYMLSRWEEGCQNGLLMWNMPFASEHLNASI